MNTARLFFILTLFVSILTPAVHGQDDVSSHMGSQNGHLGNAQAEKPIYLKLGPKLLLGRIENGQLWVDKQTVLFSIQGNLIFDGASTHHDDILLMAGTADFFSRRSSRIFFSDGKKIAYTLQKGVFYLGDNQDSDHRLGSIVQDENRQGFFQIRDASNDSMLGWIETNRTPKPAEFIAAFHLFLIQFDLDTRLNEKLKQQTEALTTNGEIGDYPAGGGIIRPMLGGNSYYEWVWDGKVLKPAWGIRAEDEWSFDGRILKPTWGRNAQEEWTWSGQIMRRTFATSTQDEWIWEGQMLRPYWDNDPDRQWRFDGQTVRPWWNSNTGLRWTVEGDIPLPVIALVVLGIADR